MARCRVVKPEFLLDERLAGISPEARLYVLGAASLADKDGILENRPLRIKLATMPHDDSEPASIIRTLLLVGIFSISEDERYLKIEPWNDWFVPYHREEKTIQDQRFLCGTIVEHGVATPMQPTCNVVAPIKIKIKNQLKMKGSENELISDQEKTFLRNLWEIYPARTSENGTPAAKGNKLAAVAQIRRAMHSENLTEQDVLDIVGVYLEHPTLKSGYIQSVERFFGPTGRWYECWQALQSDRGEANQ